MEWLNYHHLYYFWTVAKEGSISAACEKLRLAQPTISGQIHLFEETIGEKLFVRSGRKLVLTDDGQIVFRYAEEIFATGQELMNVLRGRPQNKPARFVVGISDVLPKHIAFRVLQPVLKMIPAVHLVCQEDHVEELLRRLSAHTLDLILTEAPVTGPLRVRAYNHLLGTCGVTFCATPQLAARYRKNFPASLDGAPFLLPMESSTLRLSLDQWFDRNGIRPQIVGEFQDSALLKVFGQAGGGVFVVPSAIDKEIRAQYQVVSIGRTEEIVERFYAISVERRLKHPAVVAISEAARNKLFDEPVS